MTETNQANTEGTFLSVNCDVNPELGVAAFVISKSETFAPATEESLKELIQVYGVSDWLINKSAINETITQYDKKILGRITFAERKDATCSVQISDDLMSASITATPENGGAPLTVELLTQALLNNKINEHRIDQKALTELSKITKKTTTIVARGKLPRVGKDSQFKALINDADEVSEQQEDAQGKIDFFAGRNYLTVDIGAPLLRKIPPEAGQIGMDVHGQIIPSQEGKDIPFAKDIPGAEISENDPNLIVACVVGHPIIFDNGARVDQTLKFKNVGLNTGHITFDGSVEISGDVMSDIKIDVTGDVYIKGAVERASINAGHNIVIASGALGDAKNESNEDNSKCTLIAGGSIDVRYANSANIKARQDIAIREYSFNSILIAGANVLLGQDGGKGNLVGGETIAGHAIIGKSLGSKAYVHTRLRVGASREELQRTLKLKQMHEQRIEKAKALKLFMSELKEKNSDIQEASAEDIEKAKKIQEALAKIKLDLKDIEKRIKTIEFATFKDDAPNITATSQCYPNCFLTLNGAFYKTDSEHKAISFIKKGGKITART